MGIENGRGMESVCVCVGALQYTVVDSGLAEDDIIPLLLPQEIRSQQEPWPSGERRLFQPRITSTQMNAFIIHARTHIHNTFPYGPVAMCERAFPKQFIPSKASLDNGLFSTQPYPQNTHRGREKW